MRPTGAANAARSAAGKANGNRAAYAATPHTDVAASEIHHACSLSAACAPTAASTAAAVGRANFR